MAKKTVKKAVKRKVRAEAEGDPVRVTVSHKELIPMVTRLVDTVDAITRNTHPSAKPEEIEGLANLREGLDNVVAALARIKCPNPMYVVIPVDKTKLNALRHLTAELPESGAASDKRGG